jgi:hypothetical protein
LGVDDKTGLTPRIIFSHASSARHNSKPESGEHIPAIPVLTRVLAALRQQLTAQRETIKLLEGATSITERHRTPRYAVARAGRVYLFSGEDAAHTGSYGRLIHQSQDVRS